MAKGSKDMLIQVGILLYLIATIAVVSSSRAWLYTSISIHYTWPYIYAYVVYT